MAKLKITQVRSKNGSTKRQIANLTSLGLRKMHQTVEVEKILLKHHKKSDAKPDIGFSNKGLRKRKRGPD